MSKAKPSTRAEAEEGVGDVGAERLQAALRVVRMAEQDRRRDEVDHAAADVPHGAGTLDRRGVGVAAAADGDVPARLHLRDDGEQLIGRVGEVGVGEGDGAASGGGHPSPHGGTLAPVARAGRPPGRRPPASAASAVAVGRAVVDDHDLDPAVVREPDQRRPHRGHGGRDAGGLVEGRQHDGGPEAAGRCRAGDALVDRPAHGAQQDAAVQAEAYDRRGGHRHALVAATTVPVALKPCAAYRPAQHEDVDRARDRRQPSRRPRACAPSARTGRCGRSRSGAGRTRGRKPRAIAVASARTRIHPARAGAGRSTRCRPWWARRPGRPAGAGARSRGASANGSGRWSSPGGCGGGRASTRPGGWRGAPRGPPRRA